MILKKALKRGLDIFASSIGLLFLWPLFVLLAILIKRDSPGPVFYRGLRAGRRGKNIHILKFRTMHEEPESYNGPRITAQDDQRITPLGRWLRTSKLNELPQLWNVLKGEMSLVGPRPEDPAIVATWSEAVRDEILSVRPGITSPTSVLYRNEERMLTREAVMDQYLQKILPDKLRLDRLYVRNHTLLTDVDIIFWTLIGLLPNLKEFPIPEKSLFWGPLSVFVSRFFSWFLADILVAFGAVGISGIIWRLEGPLNLGVGVAVGIAFATAVLFSLINSLLGLGRVSWQHARPAYAFDLALSSSLATLVIFLVNRFWPTRVLLPQGMVLVAGLLAFIGFTAIRYRERLITGLASRWVHYRNRASILGERVLIVGAGACGQLAAWLLEKSDLSTAFSVIGMVDDDPSKQRLNIDGYTVLGMTRDIPALVEKMDIGLIMFAISKIRPADQKQILALCRQTHARVIIIPDLLQILEKFILQQPINESAK